MEDRKYHIDLTNDEVWKIVCALEDRAKFWSSEEDLCDFGIAEILSKEYKLLEQRMRKLITISVNNG